MSGAVLGGFFPHEAYEVDGNGQDGEYFGALFQGLEHGGHGALGIGCTASEHSAIRGDHAEAVDVHARGADGIEVRAEEDTGARVFSPALEWAERDDVGTVGQNFFLGDGVADLFQIALYVIRHGGFSGLSGGRIAVWIDAGDADQGLEQGDDFAWHGFLLAVICGKYAKKMC